MLRRGGKEVGLPWLQIRYTFCTACSCTTRKMIRSGQMGCGGLLLVGPARGGRRAAQHGDGGDGIIDCFMEWRRAAN